MGIVPKCRLPESIPPHIQKVNCEISVYELEDHVGEKAFNSDLLLKLGLAKKNYCRFFQLFARKH